MAIHKTKNADINIHYRKYLNISTILVLILLILAFKFSPSSSPLITNQGIDPDWLNIEKILNTTQINKPPIPPRPKLPDVSMNEATEDIELASTQIEDNLVFSGTSLIEKSSNLIIEEEIVPFFAVEVKPEIIGGINSILKNVRYTEIARRIEIEGKVVIEFIVNEKGDVDSASIIKGIYDELDDIALNAVKLAKFSPGMQRGKPVSVKMVIPIVFKLK